MTCFSDSDQGREIKYRKLGWSQGLVTRAQNRTAATNEVEREGARVTAYQ